MQIVVKINGLDEIKAMAKKYPEASLKHINWAIRRSIISIQGDSIRNAPKDTGRLAGSMRANFGDWWGSLTADTEYAVPVHEGSVAHFPPVSALENWVRRKFGVSGRQARNLAFIIARKISISGTKGRPYMRNAVEQNENKIDADFNTALENIVKSL